MAEEVPKLLMYIPKIILKERKNNEQWVLRKVQYKNRKFVTKNCPIKKKITKDFKRGVLVGFVVLHILSTTFLMYYFNPYVGLNQRNNKMMIISYKLSVIYNFFFLFFFFKISRAMHGLAISYVNIQTTGIHS